MTKRMQELLRAAEKAVGQLVAKCQKGEPLYMENPKAVAQVSRTGKWFLNAVATLTQPLSEPATDEPKV